MTKGKNITRILQINGLNVLKYKLKATGM